MMLTPINLASIICQWGECIGNGHLLQLLHRHGLKYTVDLLSANLQSRLHKSTKSLTCHYGNCNSLMLH